MFFMNHYSSVKNKEQARADQEKGKFSEYTPMLKFNVFVPRCGNFTLLLKDSFVEGLSLLMLGNMNGQACAFSQLS